MYVRSSSSHSSHPTGKLQSSHSTVSQKVALERGHRPTWNSGCGRKLMVNVDLCIKEHHSDSLAHHRT